MTDEAAERMTQKRVSAATDVGGTDTMAIVAQFQVLSCALA